MTEVRDDSKSEEMDVRELFAEIWRCKWGILATVSTFTIVAVFYALSLPNLYKSEVTLAPVSEEGGLNLSGQLGGLAALAGVSLGDKGGDKTGLALEILKSRDFIGRFVEKNDLFIPIMAAKGWEMIDNQLIVDADLYDEAEQKWVRKVKPPFEVKPSTLETVDEFRKSLVVMQDKTTGMIKLSIEFYSPYLAKEWIVKIVDSINNEMRQRELTEAERSIEYLNNEIEKTNVADLRSMLFSLVEEQTKTVVLANVRDEYVFKTIDPAVVPEKKSAPQRAMLVTLSFISACLLSFIFILFRYSSRVSAQRS
jgi:uncharacterized protein involved in exopolysaccharide biosynthesis